MALKIKEGSKIVAYGASNESFTSSSKLSQDVLAHLQTRFPNDVVSDAPEKPLLKQEKQKVK